MNKVPNEVSGARNDVRGAMGTPDDVSTASRKPEAKGDANQGVVDQVKQAAENVLQKTKSGLEEQATQRKDDAAARVAGVASALRSTGKELRGGENAGLQRYADQAADQVEKLTEYVRSKTIGELISDAEGFARKEPAIFIGGAFALGLAAARFLKSTAHREATPEAGGRPISEARVQYEGSVG